MAKDPKVSNAVAIVGLDAMVDLVDAGTPPGLLRIYDATGGVPADADAALGSQVLLAELAMSTTAFGGAADGSPGAVATAAPITSSENATSGTAAFFRITNAAGTAIFQGTCGTSDADLIMNTVTIPGGSTVAVNSFTITLPEG
jgi:hypothetical protein